MAERLVGRRAELALVLEAVERLSSGGGGLVVLAGEAGVGKSRLASEVAAEAAARGVAVLGGRAVEGGASPLRPFAEAFLAAFRDRPPPTDPRLDPFRAALAPLVPEWQTTTPPASIEPVVRNEGILRLLRALGRGPGCLLVVEDLHWADPETLTAVEYLAEHGAHEPVLCLATVRAEAPGPGLARARALATTGKATVVDLARLHEADMAELALAAAGDALPPGAVRVVCDRAEGLPLLAEDLLATARTTGRPMAEVVPLTFAGTVQQRLATLSGDAAAVVRAAAVLGRRFDWSLLAPVAGVDDAAVGAALRAAVEAELLAAAPDGGFRFRHALTRDAVLAELLPMERRDLARRALDAVQEANPTLAGEWPEVAAGLAEEAGDAKRAATLLLDVARRAMADGALSAAETTLERARALTTDEPGILAAVDDCLLEVLSQAGKTEPALALGEAMLARQSPPDAAVTHLRMARAAAAATRWEAVSRHLAQVRTLAPDSDVAAQADALAATVALIEGRTEEAVGLAELALASGRRRDAPEVMCEALEVLGRAARPHDFDQAEAWFTAAADEARRRGLPLWEIRALHELGTVDMFRTGNVQRLEEAWRLARDAGALAIAAVVDLQIASTHALRFEPDSALRVVARGIEVARLFDLGLTLPMLLVQGATAHACAGRREEMEAGIAEAAEMAGDHPEVWVASWGHARALLALVQEDRQAALAALREALAWSRHPECGLPGAFGGWLALVATLDAPDGDAVRDERRSARGMGIPINRALLGYADAVAMGRSGRGDEAAALVAAMDDLLRTQEGWAGWMHLGRRLVAEAAIADGWGEPVNWLREGLPWFEGRGHARVVGACRRLLAEAGAPVPRRGRGDTAVPPELSALGVTSREADVLRLVAQGLSNQQMAERLFLSPRTVEKHVERLRDKTAAASRTELATLAAKYGIAAP